MKAAFLLFLRAAFTAGERLRLCRWVLRRINESVWNYVFKTEDLPTEDVADMHSSRVKLY